MYNINSKHRQIILNRPHENNWHWFRVVRILTTKSLSEHKKDCGYDVCHSSIWPMVVDIKIQQMSASDTAYILLRFQSVCLTWKCPPMHRLTCVQLCLRFGMCRMRMPDCRTRLTQSSTTRSYDPVYSLTLYSEYGFGLHREICYIQAALKICL